jgi:hypothetical protein
MMMMMIIILTLPGEIRRACTFSQINQEGRAGFKI